MKKTLVDLGLTGNVMFMGVRKVGVKFSIHLVQGYQDYQGYQGYQVSSGAGSSNHEEFSIRL